MKIFILDHSILFREGLANLLTREQGFTVVGTAGSICEAVDLIPRLAPDLLLLDAEIPDLRETNGIRQLLSRQPGMNVILLSPLESNDLLLFAVRSGARGFLQKNQNLSTLLASIHAIDRGEAVIPRAMVGQLLDEFSRMSPNIDQEGMNLLTPREMEVLSQLGQGRSNREIADSLMIAENTVKVHVHNILEKLDLSNRRQAARFARCNGLASPRIPFTYITSQTIAVG